MRFFILGNLNSGKTWLSKKLLAYLPESTYLALDDFRVRYGDGSFEGENCAIAAFAMAVINHPDAIIDFSGYGPAAEAIQQKLPLCSGVMLVCSRHYEDCIQTIDPVKYAAVPYPHEYWQVEGLRTTVRRLAPVTTEPALLDKWRPFIWQSYTIPYMQPMDVLVRHLSLAHHRLVESMKNFAHQQSAINHLIIYGSAGANVLTPESDLDFFVRTLLPADTIKALLEMHFSEEIVHSDLLGKKVTLRMQSGLLIEIVCGEQLEDTALYYRESQITNVRSTVLKGGKEVVERLEMFINDHPTPAEMASPIAGQLYFLFCSLPKLIQGGDVYKYNFHTHIMQHYAVQLESLINGNLQHNYLPKHAARSLPDFPWECFTVSPVEIYPRQYHRLYQYLRGLFFRLSAKKLVESEKYFTQAQDQLHDITVSSESYMA